MAKRKKAVSLGTSVTTSVAAQISSSVGNSRGGRDSLTRVKSPIKGVDTHGRQWNRYSP